jgi:hypothetical protein
MARGGDRPWFTVASVWVLIAGAAVTNIATNSLPALIKEHEAWFWPALVLLGLLTTYLELRRGEEDGYTDLANVKTEPTRKDRQRALEFARKSIADGLHERLGDDLKLTLSPVPAALPDERKRAVFAAEAAAMSEPTGLQAYEPSESMLVLGAAGAGKTTLLYRMAEGLLAKAEEPNAEDEPIPLVISVATWGRPRPSLRSLERWLRRQSRRVLRQILRKRSQPPVAEPPPADDLVRWVADRIERDSNYRVKRKAVLAWLAQMRLVLLLDSLDECAEEHRARFVTEFDRMVDKVGLRVVLSCRTPDFAKLPKKPALLTAWALQPLTRSQIEQAVDPDLRDALQEDSDLWELLRAPIWLRVIKRLDHWPERVRSVSVSVAERRRELLDAFLIDIFSERVGAAATVEQLTRWIAQMAQLAGAATDPDAADLRAPAREARISPSALFPTVVRAVPILLVVPFTLAFVLPLAELYGLASARSAVIQSSAFVGLPILAFLASGLVPGYDRASIPSPRKRRRLVYGAMLPGVLFGLLGFGLVLGFHTLAATSMNATRWVLVAGLALPSAILLRSPAPRTRGLVAALAVLSAASLLVSTMGPDKFTWGVAGALQGVLLMLPPLAVFSARGLSFAGFRLTPAMLIVVPATVGLVLAVYLVLWAGTWLTHGRSVLGQPMISAMTDGWLLTAVCLSGLAFLVRERLTASAGHLFLALEGRLPWRLKRLLDAAESYSLFIKSGAGYRFAHPLMQQHLAELDILDLRPPAEPDPGMRGQALAQVAQAITLSKATREPPARFPAPLSDGMDIHALAQKLGSSPGTARQPLVINGPPGSGRSTLLLDVAVELTDQPTAPVPLILPASVWGSAAIRTDRRQRAKTEAFPERTFTRLLLRAVNEEYALPPQTVRQLLVRGEIVLFLDEDRLTRRETLRFLHLIASFHEAYPKVGLVLTADLSALPKAVRDEYFGPRFLEDAWKTSIMPLDRGLLTSDLYAGYIQPLTQFGFPAEQHDGLVTTFGQLHHLVEAAKAALETQRPLADVYLAKVLALERDEQQLRGVMQKIAWITRRDAKSPGPPFIGMGSLRWTVRTPPPLARAEARCTTPLARGIILASGAYAIAPLFGTPTALAGSLVLVLLDLAWQGRPGRAGLGGAISLRQRCTALIVGVTVGFALGWAVFELHDQLVRFATSWTPLERALLFPVSAGIAIAALSLPDLRRWMFSIFAAMGLVTAAALYFAGPHAPGAFFQGFGAGVTVGAALSFVLGLETLFTWDLGPARQPWRPFIIRVAITLAWCGALCAMACWGQPGKFQLWPAVGLVLGYCCSALLLVAVAIVPAYLIYGPAFWFLAGSTGFLPWRLRPALRTAQTRGWLLPGHIFRDPLVQRFLSAEAEEILSLPSTPELFPHRLQSEPEQSRPPGRH